MANKVKEIEFRSSSEKSFKLGLSDTLDNLSTDDIWNSGISGITDNRFSNTLWSLFNAKSPFTNDEYTAPTDEPTCLTFDKMNGNYPRYDSMTLKSADNDMSNKLYGKVVLVYRDSDDTINDLYIARYSTGTSKMRLITNLDLTHMGYYISLDDTYKLNGATYRRVDWITTDVPLVTNNFYFRYYFGAIGNTDYYEFPQGRIIPYMMFKYGDKTFGFRMSYNSFRGQSAEHCPLRPDWSNTYNYNNNMTHIDGTADITAENRFSFAFNFGKNKEVTITNGTNQALCVYDNGYCYNFQDNGSVQYNIIPSELKTINDYFKNLGMHFITDKVYKPVIENNIIIGYTDDLSEKSEFDNFDYDSGTAHNVPDTPIEKDEDRIKEMSTRTVDSLTGFIHYYELSPELLDRFVTACEATAESLFNIGWTFLNNVVSVTQYPFNVNNYVITSPLEYIKINGKTLDGTHAGGADAVGAKLTATQLPIDTLGSYTINRHYNNFLDYEPYTKIEVYIPLCGWISLPSLCMGNTITVKLVTDIINGTCKGQVWCNGMIIAEKNGVCGRNIVLSATENGMKNSAVVGSISGIGGSALGIASGIAEKNPVSVAYSATNMVGSVTQALETANNSYIRTTGNLADNTNFHDNSKCYIKITRPIADIPDNYGHTIGYVCNQTKTVSECSGYTVCSNVDTTGLTATQTEKDMIKSILESGFYK